jgi:hypothetical protein
MGISSKSHKLKHFVVDPLIFAVGDNSAYCRCYSATFTEIFIQAEFMRKLFMIAGFIACAGLSAQSLTPEVIASAGTSFSNASAQLDFTIGEVVTATLTTGGHTVTQGFHQPELHFASLENYSNDFSCILYPNPTEQFVTVESTKEDHLKVSVYDMQGKVIMVSNVFVQKTTLDVQALAAGTYVMLITTEQGQPIHSYSVIKKSAY